MEIAWSIGLIIVSFIIGVFVGSNYAYRDMVREANHIILSGKKRSKKNDKR